jgi:ABC-type bacteriocin/lantibiotic exporter with double-glycine peptidase domain
MNNILTLYKIVPLEKRIFFWFILTLLTLKSFFDLLGLGSILPLIYAIFEPTKLINNQNLAFLNLSQFDEIQIIYFSTIFIFLIFLIKNIFILIHNYFLERFSNSLLVNLSKKSFSNSLDIFDGSLETYNSNELTNIIFKEITDYTQKYLKSLFTIITDIVFVIIFLIFLAIQGDIILLLFTAPLFLTAILYYIILNRYVKKIGDKRLQYDTLRLKSLKESFDLLKIIKVLNKINNFKYYLDKFTFKSTEQSRKFVLISKTLIVIAEMLTIIILCSAIFYFSNNIELFKSLLPTFIIIFLSFIKFIPMMSRITTAFQKLKFNEKALNRIYDLSTKVTSSSLNKKKEIDFKNSINFKNISFYYKNENKLNMIFKNLDFEIKKNKCYGIIGPSGSGKSTLLEIICGLLETSDGFLYQDNKKMDQTKNRFKCSYVSQDTRILNMSLKKNITLNFRENDENFEHDTYSQSIKRSNLLSFVNSLDNKDETVLGEFGSSISGGQRQRVGIARALYHNSPILILDEFTSSLDEKTENTILEDIKLLKNIKTIIITTHKKDILNICDEVFRIDQKKLIKIN